MFANCYIQSQLFNLWVIVTTTMFCCLAHAQDAPSATLNSPIIIGLDADISASAKSGGIAISQGAQLAIDEINRSGGLLGTTLKLVVKDHRGNPARGINNIEEFAELPNLAAVVGGVHTPVALAELSTIHEKNIIYLGAWAAGTAIVDNTFVPNNVFRVSVRDEEAGQTLIQHAKQQGYHSVALVLERTGWGRSNLRSIGDAAENQGIRIASVNWINWRQTDFTHEFNNIVNSKPDAIIMVTNAPEGAIVAKHMLAKQHHYPIISHWGIAGGQFTKLLGLDNLQGLQVSVLQTFHFNNTSHGSKREYLLKAYRKRYQNKVSGASIPAVVGIAQAYDIVHMLAVAIKQANSINSNDTRAALLNINEYHGAIKHYIKPFTINKQDALLGSDYFMTSFNTDGHLVPIN